MTRDAEIHQFVESLAKAEPPDDRSANIYSDSTRRENLSRWLRTFDDTPHSAIFVGEAPGRDGGAITGIPFVSPHVLTTTQDHWNEFGSTTCYRLPGGEDATRRERTATRFWKHVPGSLNGLPRPLTWNIYPFWPFDFDENGNRRNRAPRRGEIEFGSRWLERVVEMYPRSQVVAVGIMANKTLKSMGVETQKIPHPSRGSDASLIAGLEQVGKQLRV